jgi:hypothetical protein
MVPPEAHAMDLSWRASLGAHARAVGKYWVALVLGGAAGVIGVISSVAGWTQIPWWVWIAVFGLGLLAAQFRAFHQQRRDYAATLEARVKDRHEQLLRAEGAAWHPYVEQDERERRFYPHLGSLRPQTFQRARCIVEAPDGTSATANEGGMSHLGPGGGLYFRYPKDFAGVDDCPPGRYRITWQLQGGLSPDFQQVARDEIVVTG